MSSSASQSRRGARCRLFRAAAGGALTLLLTTVLPVGGQQTTPPPTPAAQRDFTGLVDIGGRRLYLECRGTGGPTVILEAGYRSPATVWTRPRRSSPGIWTHILATSGRFRI